MYFRLSFCTTSMNRLHHLRQTLPSNLENNNTYTNLEFLVLDYNSTDGLDDYILTNFTEEIETGKLVYYRTDEPENYSMSHSRNLAFKLATGDILCNIDADNFTGKGFAEYVNSCFQFNPEIFLVTHNVSGVTNDVLGRICVRKLDFLRIRGYDERMLHYGFDDFDFANRLEMVGLSKKQIVSSDFFGAIKHSNTERMNNYLEGKGFEQLLVYYESPFKSKLLFLFSDHRFSKGTIIINKFYKILELNLNNYKDTRYSHSIEESAWQTGIYLNEDGLFLSYENGHTIKLIPDGVGKYVNIDGTEDYFLISNVKLQEAALFFYNQICNRLIMEENTEKGRSIVNPFSFGISNVSKNFNKIPLSIS